MSEYEKTANDIVWTYSFDNEGRVDGIMPRNPDEIISRIAAALTAVAAAEREKWKAFAGPDGEPLALLMKGRCGEWPTDEMLEKKIPNGTMLYWVLPAESALKADSTKQAAEAAAGGKP